MIRYQIPPVKKTAVQSASTNGVLRSLLIHIVSVSPSGAQHSFFSQKWSHRFLLLASEALSFVVLLIPQTQIAAQSSPPQSHRFCFEEAIGDWIGCRFGWIRWRIPLRFGCLCDLWRQWRPSVRRHNTESRGQCSRPQEIGAGAVLFRKGIINFWSLMRNCTAVLLVTSTPIDVEVVLFEIAVVNLARLIWTSLELSSINRMDPNSPAEST